MPGIMSGQALFSWFMGALLLGTLAFLAAWRFGWLSFRTRKDMLRFMRLLETIRNGVLWRAPIHAWFLFGLVGTGVGIDSGRLDVLAGGLLSLLLFALIFFYRWRRASE